MSLLQTFFTHPIYIFLETIIFVCLPIYFSYRIPFLSRLRWVVGIVQLSYLFFVYHTLNLPIPVLTQLPTLDLFSAFLLIFTFFCITTIVILNKLKPAILYLPQPMIYPDLPLVPILILYSLFSAPLQELFFRGFYLARLIPSFSEFISILFSSFVFAIFHLPFKNKFLIVGSFVCGIIWAEVYLTTGNFMGISISHAAIGLIFAYFSHHATNLQNRRSIIKPS